MGLDHGRPDRALGQGRREEGDDRNDCRERRGRHWDNAGWQAFVKAYQDAFPPEKRFPSPSLLAVNYYNSTAALYEALNKVNGDSER
jgi:hypothetical protein